jgi:hypothetical protein
LKTEKWFAKLMANGGFENANSNADKGLKGL